MQTNTRETGADLMAQWRATGGALDAAPAQAAETGGDDSLAATGPCPTSYSFVGCRVDDDLAATGPTAGHFSCRFGDDGLATCYPTYFWLTCCGNLPPV